MTRGRRWLVGLGALLVVFAIAVAVLFAIAADLQNRAELFFQSISFDGSVIVNDQLFEQYNRMYSFADTLRVIGTTVMFCLLAGGVTLLAVLAQRWDERRVGRDGSAGVHAGILREPVPRERSSA